MAVIEQPNNSHIKRMKGTFTQLGRQETRDELQGTIPNCIKSIRTDSYLSPARSQLVSFVPPEIICSLYVLGLFLYFPQPARLETKRETKREQMLGFWKKQQELIYLPSHTIPCSCKTRLLLPVTKSTVE